MTQDIKFVEKLCILGNVFSHHFDVFKVYIKLKNIDFFAVCQKNSFFRCLEAKQFASFK